MCRRSFCWSDGISRTQCLQWLWREQWTSDSEAAIFRRDQTREGGMWVKVFVLLLITCYNMTLNTEWISVGAAPSVGDGCFQHTIMKWPELIWPFWFWLSLISEACYFLALWCGDWTRNRIKEHNRYTLQVVALIVSLDVRKYVLLLWRQDLVLFVSDWTW